MIHSARFNVILDANVIYPAPLRDFLLRLAEQGYTNPSGVLKFKMNGFEIY